MGVQAHMLSARVVMYVVGAGSDEISVDGWRKARFTLDCTAGQWLHGRSGGSVYEKTPKGGGKLGELTATARGVPLDAEPDQIRLAFDCVRKGANIPTPMGGSMMT